MAFLLITELPADLPLVLKSNRLEALREKRQEQEGQYWEKFILPRWNRMYVFFKGVAVIFSNLILYATPGKITPK